MPTVRLPAPFLRYACEHSQVCCKHPIRAPCEPDEETRIASILASTDAGRAHLPILRGGFEASPDARIFKQEEDGRCVHLARGGDGGRGPGCSLQLIGGAEALAPACRNFPRWVARLPEEPGREVALEALFVPICPTAARLLAADPSPFRFVEVPLERWPYLPTRAASAPELAQVEALRAGWWAVLAERRDDPEHLLRILDAMLKDPLGPREHDEHRLHAELWAGLQSVDARFMNDALERRPDRGASYAPWFWEVRHDLICDYDRSSLLAALDIAPGLLVAYLEHLIPFGGLHDARPLHVWLHIAVRRTLAVARMADSLLARVPYRIDTLFADLFGAAMHADATGFPGFLGA
jgi:hypothetical protein